MALDATQKLKVRLALGEPLEEQATIDALIATLSAEALTYLAALIVQWDAVATNTVTMVVDGVSIDNQKTAARVSGLIAITLGWMVADAGSILMGRGQMGTFNSGRASQSVDSGW